MGMKIKHIFLIVNHSITIVNQEIVQEAATRREFIGSSKNSNSKATHSSKTKSVFTGRELALIDAKSHEVKSCLARTVIRDAIILCFSAAPTSTSCLLPAYLRPIGNLELLGLGHCGFGQGFGLPKGCVDFFEV